MDCDEFDVRVVLYIAEGEGNGVIICLRRKKGQAFPLGVHPMRHSDYTFAGH
jgi:hypothetical protein